MEIINKEFNTIECEEKICKYYNKIDYQLKPSPKRVTDHAAHWIIALFSDEGAIKNLKSIKNKKFIENIDPNTDISTLGLAILFKKQNTTQFLLGEYFNQKKLLETKFINFTKLDQHYLKGIFQYSLKNAWYVEGNETFKLSTLCVEEINQKLGVKSYQDYFYSKFGDENKQCLGNECDCKKQIVPNFYLEDLKKSYTKNPPAIIIQENQVLKNAGINSNLGVFAKEPIAPYTYIGEYFGEFKQCHQAEGILKSEFYEHFSFKEESEYLFSNIDAQETGNFTRLMNFGFPNVVPCANCSEFKREVFVSFEKIEEGEELLWNYGATYYHRLYASKFILFNKEKMIEFFNGGVETFFEKFNQLVSLCKSKYNLENNLKAFWNIVRVEYVLAVPAAFIFLHAKRIINMSELFESDSQIIEAYKSLKKLPFLFCSIIKEFFKDLDLELSKNEKMRDLVYDLIINQVENISTIQLLHVLQLIHTYIEDKTISEENFVEKTQEILNSLKTYSWKDDVNHPLSTSTKYMTRIEKDNHK